MNVSIPFQTISQRLLVHIYTDLHSVASPQCSHFGFYKHSTYQCLITFVCHWFNQYSVTQQCTMGIVLPKHLYVIHLKMYINI
jgi:hypothetical protein